MARASSLILCAVCGCSDYGASTDATSTDASAPDAAADAAPGSEGDAADGGGGPFCASKLSAFLCDDFDNDAPIGFNWTEVATRSGGVVEKATGESRSAPKALFANASGFTGGFGWAYLNKNVGIGLTHVVVSFALRVESMGSSYAVLGGNLVRATSSHQVQLLVMPTGSVEVQEAFGDEPPKTYPLSRSPIPGMWTRISLDVNRATPSARVLVDGVEVLNAVLAHAVSDGTNEIDVGLTWFTDAAWKVRFDDVLIELP